ncbi:MAG: hypothetical protein H7A20_03375 [Rhodanobacteraceae bacterium]|nr:hypothetical protein [Xanthomonadales bacterium]MCP5477824.1 hypothetical protein [Rhodanobacteraceae bacterium]HPF72745.1 hypothetical protein [Xanthomonadaceae bacterium]HRX99721.1 hypothetical protein [Xanthomonadaceae bacterium]
MPHLTRALLAFTALTCPLLAAAQDDRFRINDMALRDPHVFVDFISCFDVTDDNPLGYSVNGELQAAIQSDGDGDGLLDFSSLIEFLPLDQNQSANLMETGPADCSAPMAGTQCGPISQSQLAGDATLSSSITCLSAEPGSLHGYVPALVDSEAPCFASPTGALTLDLGGIPLPLQAARVGARFVDSPASSLDLGVMRGFVSETDADNTILPAGLPIIGGLPLSALLPGGTGNCAAHDDRDMLEGVRGWWFYLNFSAERIQALVPDVFRNGFEDPT